MSDDLYASSLIIKFYSSHRYDVVERSNDASAVQTPTLWIEPNVLVWLQGHVALINHTVPAPDEDIFEQGFDRHDGSIVRLTMLTTAYPV